MARITLEPGTRFGRLAVVSFAGVKRNGKSGLMGLHLCICDCGRQVVRPTTDLVRGKRTSCGYRVCHKRWRGGMNIAGSEAWASKKLRTLKAHSRLGGYCEPYEDAERILELWQTCGGACACCGRQVDGALHLDHCHDTGRMRGFICKTCNTCIGFVGESASRLVSMAAWVASQPA